VGMMSGVLEGISLVESAMEKFRELPPVDGDTNRLRKGIYAHACLSLGVHYQGAGEIILSRNTLQESIAIARELGDKRMLGLALELYANSSAMIKANDVLAPTMEGLEIFRELNEHGGMAMAYGNLVRWETINGNFQEAEKYAALVRANMEGGSYQLGFLNMGMGVTARVQGHYDRAQRYFEDGLRIFKQIGHKGMIAVMISEIAHMQRAMGKFIEAKKTYQETIKIFQDYGNRPAVAHQLECFAMIAIVEEEPQRAAQLFAAAEAIREVTGHKRTEEEELEEAQFIERLHAILSEAEFNALWAEGKSMRMDQAIQFALR
jgi:tetratricopeptide (TPR) repeat protein